MAKQASAQRTGSPALLFVGLLAIATVATIASNHIHPWFGTDVSPTAAPTSAAPARVVPSAPPPTSDRKVLVSVDFDRAPRLDLVNIVIVTSLGDQHATNVGKWPPYTWTYVVPAGGWLEVRATQPAAGRLVCGITTLHGDRVYDVDRQEIHDTGMVVCTTRGHAV
jgi:hypothetical protein